jgi:hypothetical protein
MRRGGGSCGVSSNDVHRSPNKLWRFNSTFNRRVVDSHVGGGYGPWTRVKARDDQKLADLQDLDNRYLRMVAL